jgi:hypothetical protein
LILFISPAIQKTKALLAAEEEDEDEDDADISQSQNHQESEDENPQPSKRVRSNRLSMDDEELAYAMQFKGSSAINNTNFGHISGEEQEPGYGEDLEVDQQRNDDNLMLMDKNDDIETNIFGGGESNGVCRLFYHIHSIQFYFSSY